MVDVWSFIMSMFFATLEGIAIYSLILYIFRIELKSYIWHSLAVITAMNLHGQFIMDSSVSYLSQITNFVFTILFMRFVIKIPLIGSLVSVIIGYFGYAIIQFTVIMVLFGTFDGINDNESVRWQIQLLSGVAGVVVGKLLYKFGIGFSNNFDRFEFPFEKQIMVVLAVFFGIGFGYILYSQNYLLSGVFFTLAMVSFIYYGIRKEAVN